MQLEKRLKSKKPSDPELHIDEPSEEEQDIYKLKLIDFANVFTPLDAAEETARAAPDEDLI